MTRTTLFRSNGFQAIRLPKEAAFPEGVKAVTVLRDGARRVIVPTNASWDDFFAEPGFPMPDREQPAMQERASRT
jgi:antitoxin VapB